MTEWKHNNPTAASYTCPNKRALFPVAAAAATREQPSANGEEKKTLYFACVCSPMTHLTEAFGNAVVSIPGCSGWINTKG